MTQDSVLASSACESRTCGYGYENRPASLLARLWTTPHCRYYLSGLLHEFAATHFMWKSPWGSECPSTALCVTIVGLWVLTSFSLLQIHSPGNESLSKLPRIGRVSKPGVCIWERGMMQKLLKFPYRFVPCAHLGGLCLPNLEHGRGCFIVVVVAPARMRPRSRASLSTIPSTFGQLNCNWRRILQVVNTLTSLRFFVPCSAFGTRSFHDGPSVTNDPSPVNVAR